MSSYPARLAVQVKAAREKDLDPRAFARPDVSAVTEVDIGGRSFQGDPKDVAPGFMQIPKNFAKPFIAGSDMVIVCGPRSRRVKDVAPIH